MSDGDVKKEQEAEGPKTVIEPIGLDEVGDDSDTALPDEAAAIELPIEQGDFDAQTL